MKNSKTVVSLLGLILVGTALSCKLFSGATDGNGNSSGTNSNNTNSSLKSKSGEECPTTALGVSTLQYGTQVKKYDGCSLSVEGKLWDVQYSTIILSEDDQGLNKVDLAGDFSSATYLKIQAKVSEIKRQGDFNKLPNVTFDCRVNNAALTGCALH